MTTSDVQRIVKKAIDDAVIDARKQGATQGHVLHPFNVRYDLAHAGTACRKCGRLVEVDVRALKDRARTIIGGTAMFMACGAPLLRDESASGSRVAPTARGGRDVDTYSMHVDRLAESLSPHELAILHSVSELERESWGELQPPDKTPRFNGDGKAA